jgi:DNA-3-methyladenine glycosylase
MNQTHQTTPPLSDDFYRREKHVVARDLLGRHLVRRHDGQLLVGRIVEVEVYGGPHDPSSHGDTGEPTDRTRAMFGPPGTAYIYQIYGMYHCLNVVVPAEQKAAAVLIRAMEPIEGLEAMADGRGLTDKYDGPMTRSVRGNLLSGPGKICQALHLDGTHDGRSLDDEPLWLSAGEPVARTDETVETTERIGLNPDTVGEAVEWPWRYVLAESDYLSR